MINEETPNVGLLLPNEDNDLLTDVARIKRSFQIIDNEFKIISNELANIKNVVDDSISEEINNLKGTLNESLKEFSQEIIVLQSSITNNTNNLGRLEGLINYNTQRIDGVQATAESLKAIATPGANGLLSSSDKQKLDSIAWGAQTNPDMNLYLAKAGGVMTGGIELDVDNLCIAQRNIADFYNVTPSRNIYSYIEFLDVNWHRIGALIHGHFPNGISQTYIEAISQNQVYANIGVVINADGSVAHGEAPNPPLGHDQNSIATTWWVRRNLPTPASLFPTNRGNYMGWLVGFDNNFVNPGHISIDSLKAYVRPGLVTTAADGLMTAGDKQKLDSIAWSANYTTVANLFPNHNPTPQFVAVFNGNFTDPGYCAVGDFYNLLGFAPADIVHTHGDENIYGYKYFRNSLSVHCTNDTFLWLKWLDWYNNYTGWFTRCIIAYDDNQGRVFSVHAGRQTTDTGVDAYMVLLDLTNPYTNLRIGYLRMYVYSNDRDNCVLYTHPYINSISEITGWNGDEVATTQWVKAVIYAYSPCRLADVVNEFSTTRTVMVPVETVQDYDPLSDTGSPQMKKARTLAAEKLKKTKRSGETPSSYIDVEIPLTQDELKHRLRIERGLRLWSVDMEMNALNRELRLAKTETEKQKINDKIAKWDQYAVELCDITKLPGCPWDGGG